MPEERRAIAPGPTTLAKRWLQATSIASASSTRGQSARTRIGRRYYMSCNNGYLIHHAVPHDLDWAVHVLRDLNGADDTVDVEPPSEPAANQMIVDHDLIQRQTCGFRRCAWARAKACVPTQISQPSLRT